MESLKFGYLTVEPSVRRLAELVDVVYDRDWLRSQDLDTELYFMYRDLARTPEDRELIKSNGLRYDITVIPPLMLGREYVKTLGHYHPLVPETEYTYPELYSVLEGEAHYILQKMAADKILDVVFIEASAGDNVVIPPNYGHITVNPSKTKTLRMANWVSRDFESIYEPILRSGGGAYVELESGLEPNPKYGGVPEIRRLEPANHSELGLGKGTDMYKLVSDLSRLEFLNKPQSHQELFERVLHR